MTTRIFPRPAGMGYICDNWYPNPAYRPDSDLPQLLRCQEPATTRLTLLTPDDCYQVKRCSGCANRLRQEAARGAMFEIVAEENS
ncbi:MAG: hypothetical protein KJ077_11815 [Anaerolineae bacterium]|nr:hypothetical protein [Anaerolineae bacterium]